MYVSPLKCCVNISFCKICAEPICYSGTCCFVDHFLCATFDAQDGETALMYAASRGYVDCARLLMDAGADKDAQCNVRDLGYRQLLC